MGKNEDTHAYDDIIDLPHPVSQRHASMPLRKRAAQFSPFAAVTGFDAMIREVERQTEAAFELDESAKELLDRKLRQIANCIQTQPQVNITYFVPDAVKSGGAYVKHTGWARRIDLYEKQLVLTDGKKIPFDKIYDLQIPWQEDIYDLPEG